MKGTLKEAHELRTAIYQYRKALQVVASGEKFDTATAKILAENGFTVRHEYFTNDEYVKNGECTGYRIDGREWEHFFNSRMDFPALWSIVK
ncbi:hypothetical protein DIREPILLOW8_211 [Vibrio phage Direpillow8]|nr:hypothetical protein DIREPILLOW8_5 [Vibrio phage Direpillow8]QKN85631.1 hypothetical protein DIREPILLOW8_211 [Vibrio phage Direpillow8]